MKKRRIDIFDTTLRDGEQGPGCLLTLDSKLAIAEKLDLMGVDIIEAGFPISSPGDFKSVQEISKIIKNAKICALARARKLDIDTAAEALKKAKRSRIQLGIGASDIHIKNKFNTTRDEILSIAHNMVKYAANKVDEVQFFAEDAGRADNIFLAKMVQTVIDAGATVVNLPDTNGFCTPFEYYEKIKYIIEHVPNIHKAKISVHCHNDLGMATANAVAGLLAGAEQVEGTINGVGERAGNTALEEVIVTLFIKNLPIYTDVNPVFIGEISKIVENAMSNPIQANKAIVGKNAFAHSSGIHQDGVLKNRNNYEIIDPVMIGIELPDLILTSRSGRAALRNRLEALNIYSSEIEFEQYYERFLAIADTQSVISDKDLIAIFR
ncbi:MAG: 2-isopropylmalate synthase [Sphingobacterium sp.]|jgi:2-isopropylmalate synthase|nr:2-isopropylmalate synthase [Sphingobacterium sp.]